MGTEFFEIKEMLMNGVFLGTISDIAFREVSDIISDDIRPITCNPNAEASFECSCNCDIDLLNELVGHNIDNSFNMAFEVPIMIQARWHKKPRIRKKWLKKYGMKPDTIAVETPMTSGEYNSKDNTLNFNTDKLNYKLKPYQMRKEIKITK